MQKADGVAFGIVGPEGVGADELGKTIRLMRIGSANGAHLMQDDGDARLGDLPGGFRPGKASADDVDRFESAFHSAHGNGLSREQPAINWL
ncbi:hypothetical protein MAE02_21980 [Microvirga aerophila]|uniref:Uncharacterized protein n=1 Tax=Microvirga aerophila TaxID=670291 RepID=A0A512BRD7_9HYPH|nr:hypothetical protein MAE02_21980 [Microvirga aerophila]